MSNTIEANIEGDGSVLNGLDFYLPDIERAQTAQ